MTMKIKETEGEAWSIEIAWMNHVFKSLQVETGHVTGEVVLYKRLALTSIPKPWHAVSTL
jgi:hypothetical protein